ncbi:replication-relaxation family protein [Heyndrickxia acidicola]|uniref:Replication-relaxation family protein n=1 Tax=Heyndrickxia acidicola TaxID=209389 RepID=A0ABU6MFV3_9BACI|nr:replication-relaxation family protein [Heyndrickxia acidicola]MED1202558.1 replication-relaxation family protein [Heyndrickxia acidicola]
MLTKRDVVIVKALNKFKVMDRDSIAEIFFSNLKNPEKAANNVLLRLMRDGQIQRSTAFVPYVYFGPDSTVKKNSAKIGHWLAILEVFKEVRRLGSVDTFLVEPKYGSKGTVEPDAYTNYRKTGFFVECQRTLYSDKQLKQKLDRYVDFFNSGVMAKFPHVLIISDHRYAIDGTYPFRVFQAESFTQFVESLKPEPRKIKQPPNSGVLKVRLS